MTYLLFRELARLGQKTKIMRPFVSWYSRARCALRSGGLVIIPDKEIYTTILGEMGKKTSNEFSYYLEELISDRQLEEQFTSMCKEHGVTKYKNWSDKVTRSPGNAVIYYALIREVMPQVVVETGTATGSMTAYILAALNKNGKGILKSIDIPPVKGHLTMNLSLASGDIGYWIPEVYRKRWTYLEGDAKLLLPTVMADEKVDFFIHDSLHTRSHMMFEYSVARALMPRGAIIASDDVLWNNSYDDFLMINRLRGYAPYTNPNIAVAVNSFDAFEIGQGLDVVR
ncbi:Methyltransferase domain containing protein [Oxalobacteraceae bacterium]